MNRREAWAAILQWVVLGAAVGVLCGIASVLFLYLLQHATNFRTDHIWLVYTLPVAGLVIGWIYQRFGQSIQGGNNLVIDTIHDDGPKIPLRMAPMVLIGTVLTHLFGGSAGREGTAVQMGASIADGVAHGLKLPRDLRRQLLAAGVAGGFGSVFGTPIAGCIFGLEFIVLGHIQYDALVPALLASVVGDLTARTIGHLSWVNVLHSDYTPAPATPLDTLLVLKWLLFAGAVAATVTAFIELTHGIKRFCEKHLRSLPLRLCCGGATVVLLWTVIGDDQYLGLGVPTILKSFHAGEVPSYAFTLKLLFTAITLGAGFLGGEVTPLFFIGAALGSALAPILGLPPALAAGVGMATVFGVASNTPLALSIMAVELLGAHAFPHVVIVCVVAYLLSGHRSIYSAQRLLRHKSGRRLPAPLALRDWPRQPLFTPADTAAKQSILASTDRDGNQPPSA